MEKQVPYNKAFYKKYGIKVTDEPLPGHATSEYEMDMLGEMYDLANSPNPPIDLMEKMVKEYPHLPGLKNYLSLAYKQNGDKLNAKRVLVITRREHPNYFFGIINEAEELIKENQLKRANNLLGTPRDIKRFYPNEEILHCSAVLSYQAVCIMYDLAVENTAEAIAKHELMFDFDPKDHRTEILGELVASKKLLERTSSLKDLNKGYVEVESFPTVDYEPSSDNPKFIHPAIDDFYEFSLGDFSEEHIQEIIDLPRESLIEDLIKVVKCNIQRYRLAAEKDLDFDYFEYGDSLRHAFYFLGALEAEESLPIILDLFRQGKECIMFYFGDLFYEYGLNSLYFIGKNKLPELKAFILEPNVYNETKTGIIQIVEQVAWHNLERKQEVSEWLEDCLEKFLEQEGNTGLIDTFVIGNLLSSSAKLKLRELLPLAKKVHDKGWVPDNYMGDWEQIEKDFEGEMEDWDKDPLPENIFEFYSKAYKNRRVKNTKALKEIEAIEAKITPHEKYLDDKVMDKMMEVIEKKDGLMDQLAEILRDGEEYGDEPEEFISKGTYHNIGKKVGRNDPCPCGSGKKYKKCHLKK